MLARTICFVPLGMAASFSLSFATFPFHFSTSSLSENTRRSNDASFFWQLRTSSCGWD